MAEPNALLADRYRLIRQVGRGGMGVVWEGWDERLQRPVAVKQLHAQLGLPPEEAELAKNRAMREARITARLHHRNAVPVFDVVEHEGQPCLIMQFLPSVPLSAVIREGGPLEVHEAAQVGAQVASALAAAHALDIVHRDVKPGNVLIADDGTALISDFGISHALGDATLTSTGLVHGTPAYLAPEVARGGESGFASDVFSLGGTLYAALEGAPPFGTDPNPIILLHKVASGDFAPPKRAGVLTPLLVEMLTPDPAARPSMREVASRLAAAQTAAGESAATLLMPLPPRPEPTSAGAPPVAATSQEPPAAAPEGGPVAASFAPAQTAAASVTTPSPAEPPFPSGPPQPPADRPRRGAVVLVAVVLVVGLALLATALLRGQLGQGDGTAASDPTAVASASAPSSPTASGDRSSAAPPTSSAPPPTPSATRTTATASAAPTPTPAPTRAEGAPSAADLAAAVTDYYGLMPEQTDEAWPRLTARYQASTAGGRRSYERFWAGVDRVSVSNVRGRTPGTVEATVTYRYRNDRVVVERTSYRLVQEDGTLKIDGTTVLTSSTQ